MFSLCIALTLAMRDETYYRESGKIKAENVSRGRALTGVSLRIFVILFSTLMNCKTCNLQGRITF